MSIQFVIVLICMVGTAWMVVAQEEDPQAEALRTMQIGMQGLMQAGQDPALLAQLMQDLQVRRN